MILVELKLYLKKVKKANLTQLCQHFNTQPEFMRLLLQQWMNKAKVRKADSIPGCGTRCTKCLPQIAEIYEWVG